MKKASNAETQKRDALIQAHLDSCVREQVRERERGHTSAATPATCFRERGAPLRQGRLCCFSRRAGISAEGSHFRSRLLNASIFSCQRTSYKPFTNPPATAGSRLFRSAHPGLKSRAGGPQLTSELLDADTSRLRRNATQLLRGTAIEGRRHQPRDLPQLIPESHWDRGESIS